MHIDYLSYSLDVRMSGLAHHLATSGLSALNGAVPPELLTGKTLADARILRRAPYREGLGFAGWSVYFGGQDTLLIEISGQGCAKIDVPAWIDTVRHLDGLWRFNKCTRLDVAHDLDVDASPFDLVSHWQISPRIKSRNVQSSVSGQTFYVGSRTSSRFCRVYRYNRPHPRAGTPRVEFQFNKAVSKNIALELADGTTSPSALWRAAFSKTFVTPFDDTEAPEAPVTRTYERANSGTVTWFYRQVAPALRRLLDEGELTLDDLLAALDGEGEAPVSNEKTAYREKLRKASPLRGDE